ncbi:hypothetical protein G7Y89_g8049 [Cudoniella acicularis]|uniref:Uncharacterized protein n=1 Tax=Cudoniella acicularis TaxID=354080 RepID=A0A8H4RK30_9HELO|nr:hypothetical protein G7Y89_g8049 [Cudoniella acicularis]
MKYTRQTLVACLLSLLLTAEAQPGPHGGVNTPAPLAGPKKGLDSLSLATPPTAVTSTFTSRSTTELSSSGDSTIITQTTTLTTISHLTSASEGIIFTSFSTSIPTSTPSSTDDVTSEPSSMSSMSIADVPYSSASIPSSDQSPSNHLTLIIVLSVVLGVVGILLIISTVFLTHRYCKGQSPFAHRGASPINDDEIASWRGPVLEQKQQVLPTQRPPGQDVSTIGLAQFPGWRWNSSPSNIQPVYSPSTSTAESPSFRAPNSRAGLTDETIPGAEPYIPPMKRQGSRLSKTPPGHSRTRSRRSSVSAKSMWSAGGNSVVNIDWKPRERQPTWYDPEDNNVGRELRDLDHASSSPGTSIFDELNAGGLSPRPASHSRPWGIEKEIGRAIA